MRKSEVKNMEKMNRLVKLCQEKGVEIDLVSLEETIKELELIE